MIGSITSGAVLCSRSYQVPNDELKKQIELETAELAAAPPVPSAGLAVRCHFCGQLTTGGTTIYGPMPHDGMNQLMQLKGVCCGG